MTAAARPSRMIYPAAPMAERSPPPDGGSWDALERLLRDLQECQESAAAGLHSLLRTVHAGIRADVVFLFDAAKGEVLGAAGEPAAPGWCRDLAERVLRDVPGTGSRFVRPGSGGEPAAPPVSLALVQVSKSRATWLIAVRRRADRPFAAADLRVMALGNVILANHRRQARLYARLKDTLFEMIHCLTAAIDAKDPYTCGHSERVARMSVRLARALELSEDAVSDLYLAGLLHDVGKIGIRDSVLQKPGKLTDEELEHIKLHPVIGDRIVSKVSQLTRARPGVRHHHERFDGQGYPDRLAGVEIPLQARIVAVADSCDAMLSPRSYRPAMPVEQMEAILRQGAGSQWDAQVVERFLACRQDLYGIRQQGIGDSLAVAVHHTLGAGVSPYSLDSSFTLLPLGRSQQPPVLG